MNSYIYRVTVDERGEEDCRDFTARADAMAEFNRAAKRKTVFTVRVDRCDVLERGAWVRIAYCDNEEPRVRS
jgi:hypothetical protein